VLWYVNEHAYKILNVLSSKSSVQLDYGLIYKRINPTLKLNTICVDIYIILFLTDKLLSSNRKTQSDKTDKEKVTQE
jgi:hypothetical protein